MNLRLPPARLIKDACPRDQISRPRIGPRTQLKTKWISDPRKVGEIGRIGGDASEFLTDPLQRFNEIASSHAAQIGRGNILDAIQTSLEWGGMFLPGGDVLDLLNAGISLTRGKYGDAAAGVTFAIPVIGTVFAGAKRAKQAPRVLFGQRRISATFSKADGVPAHLRGRSIEDVAGDLRAGRLSPDDVPIGAFRGADGDLVSVNNRSIAALSEAGMQPTRIEIVTPTPDELNRLLETPIIDSPLPGVRVPVTKSASDLTVLRTIRIP